MRTLRMNTSIYSPPLLLFILLALFPFKNIYSQGFYFNLGGGYGFNSANISNVNLCSGFNDNYYPPLSTPFSFTGANQTYIETETNSQETYTNNYASVNKGFGGGVSFFVSAGYAITRNISAEIGFSYLAGITQQSTNIDNYQSFFSPDDTSYNDKSLASKLTSSPRYRLMPAIKLSVPLNKFTPYVKAGLVVGLGGKLTLSNIFTENEYQIEYGRRYNDNIGTANTGLTASGGLSLGYTASAGVEYAIADFLSVYCEINLISENWSPANGDITTYSLSSGIPGPYALSSSQFTYSGNITTGGRIPTTYTGVVILNSQYPKQTFSFGSYGVSIGVKFSIPRNKALSTPKVPDSNMAPKTN